MYVAPCVLKFWYDCASSGSPGGGPGTAEICFRVGAYSWPNSGVAIHLASSIAWALCGECAFTPYDPSTKPEVSGWSTLAPGGGGASKKPICRSGLVLVNGPTSYDPPGYIAALPLVNSVCASG